MAPRDIEFVRTLATCRLGKIAQQQDRDLRLVVGHLGVIDCADKALESSQNRPSQSFSRPTSSIPRYRRTSFDGMGLQDVTVCVQELDAKKDFQIGSGPFTSSDDLNDGELSCEGGNGEHESDDKQGERRRRRERSGAYLDSTIITFTILCDSRYQRWGDDAT